jgi:hypothetical protein
MIMKRIIITLILLSLQGRLFAQQEMPSNIVLQDGEELRYKVKWQFFHLGTITVRTERDRSDSTLCKIIMIVESNPNLPFVKVHEYNESLISVSDMMSESYLGVHHNAGGDMEIRYMYDSANKRASYIKTDLSTGNFRVNVTLENVAPYVEGPTLFFYSRWQSGSNRVMWVPTIVNEKIEETELDFTLGQESLKVDAFKEPIRTRKYKCTPGAGSKSATSAGVSGEFFGWMSDDDEAVPIRFEMKILLGSIHVELEQWTRPGWNPPLYVKVAKN